MCLYTGGSTTLGINLQESMTDDRKVHMYVFMTNQQYIIYCEIIINRGVLIFVDFLVHLNHKNQIQHNPIFPLMGIPCNV